MFYKRIDVFILNVSCLITLIVEKDDNWAFLVINQTPEPFQCARQRVFSKDVGLGFQGKVQLHCIDVLGLSGRALKNIIPVEFQFGRSKFTLNLHK